MLALCCALLLLLILNGDVFGRVGGGQSYGGGGGGGGGDGAAGAILWLVFQLFRILLYLTIEYPLIGIPLDIIVVGGVFYLFFWRRQRIQTGIFSTAAGAAPALQNSGIPTGGFVREFEQLRKFDPNFSEIIFTDFCYALYGKAQEARGRGAEALDLYSPYLSEAARSSLVQRNQPGLKEVKGSDCWLNGCFERPRAGHSGSSNWRAL